MRWAGELFARVRRYASQTERDARAVREGGRCRGRLGNMDVAAPANGVGDGRDCDDGADAVDGEDIGEEVATLLVKIVKF